MPIYVYMKKLILIIFIPVLNACSHDVNTCDLAPNIDYSKPGVLIIGDSVSIGYTSYVRQQLPQFDIIHNACNGETAEHALANVDKYMDYRFHWKLVVFNQGLWNLHDDPGPYAQVLKAEGLKLQTRADAVIFMTTTTFDTTRLQDNMDITQLNSAAISAMNSININTFDLNTVSIGLPHDLVGSPHFTEPSYETLAHTVSNSILESINGN